MGLKRVKLTYGEEITATVSDEHVKLFTGRDLDGAVASVNVYQDSYSAAEYLTVHGVGVTRRRVVTAEVLPEPESTPETPASPAASAPTTLGAPMFVAGPASDGEAGEAESADFLPEDTREVSA